MEKETYNGFEIRFEEKNEEWVAYIEVEGATEKQRIANTSIKKLKETLDKLKRNAFARVPCFVRTSHHRMGGGKDEKYLPYYTEATITSVSPNGNAWVVQKGKKTAERHGLRWSDDIIEDTPQNRKLIAQYEEQSEIEFHAEKKQVKLREQFKKIDGRKLYEKVYGKDL